MALKNMPGYTDKVFCLKTAILYGVVWFELDLERIGGGSDQVWEYFSTKSPERFVGSIAIRDLYIIVLTFLLREKRVVWLLPSIILDETQSTIVITHHVGKKNTDLSTGIDFMMKNFWNASYEKLGFF